MNYNELLKGNYDGNWPSHDQLTSCTAEHGVLPASDFGKPIWNGDVEDITLLVNAEFGDGDTIQFWRFIDEVKKRVKKVVLRCNESFKDFFTGIELVGKDEPLPEFDKIIHMMALPNVLNIIKSDISGKPYLTPNPNINPQTAIQCISVLKFSKLGICWAGNPFNPRDHIRSFDVELIDKLMITDFPFFSLNKLYEPPKSLFDARNLLSTWNDTAHLIKQMSLVISVDTAIAHLAAAMGVPVWLLVPTIDPDWRWGTKGMTTCWYDSIRIYRNYTNWSETMDVVVHDFKKWLNEQLPVGPSGLVCGQ